MGVYSATKGLDPAISTGSGATGGTELIAIYDTVMRWDPETGDYEPRLAESLEPNADYSEWTLKLKKDLRFGNGDPFTAQAVAASITRHKDPATKSPSKVLADYVADMQVVDDTTVVFRLVEPWTEFPYVLADEPGMVPNPAVLQQLGPEAFNTAPVGAGVGPYEVERFMPGEPIVLKAKQDYWDGPVCIEELRFVASQSPAAIYESFKSGQFNVAFIDNAEVLQQVREDGAEAFHDILGGQGILMNNGVRGSVTPTSDERVRQAILHALDVEAIDQRVNDGAAEATSALFGEKSLYHSDVDGPDYDPTLAKRLVDEVKTQSGWDGTIRLTCTTAQSADSLAVKTMLDAVGFNVQQDTVPATADLTSKVIVDANFDLACWSVQLFDVAPWVKLDRFLRSDSSANRVGYANPEMDAALEELRVAGTVEERRDIIGQIQEIWNESGPLAVLRAGEPSVIWADDVHGLRFNQETMIYFDDAYLE
jgi:peptide/nickel transport system substrate-binding protein